MHRFSLKKPGDALFQQLFRSTYRNKTGLDMTISGNGGNPARPGTIPYVFFGQAAARGNQVSMRRKVYGLWRDVTWTEYAAMVRAVGAGLISLGLEPGDCVSIIGENIPEWLYTDLGTQSAGGITVGIYTTNAAEECRFILKHSRSRVFVVENEEQLDKALEVRNDLPELEKIIVIDMEGLHRFSDPMVISWDDFIAQGREFDRADPGALNRRLADLDPEEAALLIYTSGTTGPPKGAMLTHDNIVWTAQCMSAMFGITAEEEVISFLPLSHIAERILSVYIAVSIGYRVHFVENTDTVTQNMTEVSPTFMFSVPRIWEKYHSSIFIKMKDATWLKRLVFGACLNIGRRYAQARLDLDRAVPAGLKIAFALADWTTLAKLRKRLGFDRLKLPISGAAPISPDVLRFYHAIGVPLRQIYGQTEGSGPTSVHQGELIDPGNTGPPLPGVEVKIAEDGEILVKGPNVFKGYFRNPEATAETLVDGWLHSGDVGEIDQRGFLKITDRKKDLIITSGGKNIAPQNLENQLKFSPYINDAVVIGDGRKFLSALIIIDEDNVVKFAQDAKVQFTTYASLTRAEEVQTLIKEEIRSMNKDLAQVEKVKRFTILPKKLMEEDGEVTPTMKVKRKGINEAFSDLIEAMYKGGGINVGG